MTPDLAARLRAYREDAQRRFDAHGLPKRGTTNRARSAWVAENGHLLPDGEES